MIDPDKTMNLGEADEAIVRTYAVLYGSFPLKGGGIKAFDRVQFEENGKIYTCKKTADHILYNGRTISVRKAKHVLKKLFDVRKYKQHGNFRIPELIHLMNGLGITEFKAPARRAYDIITINKGRQAAFMIESAESSSPSFGNASMGTRIYYKIVPRNGDVLSDHDRCVVLDIGRRYVGKKSVSELNKAGYEIRYSHYGNDTFCENLGTDGSLIMAYALQVFLENDNLAAMSDILDRVTQDKQRFDLKFSDVAIRRKAGDAIYKWWINGNASSEWDTGKNKGCGGIILKSSKEIVCIPYEEGKWESKLIESSVISSPSTVRHKCGIFEEAGELYVAYALNIRGKPGMLIDELLI